MTRRGPDDYSRLRFLRVPRKIPRLVAQLMSTLSIIIVNWNAGDQLQQAIDSVAAIADEADIDQLWVVDNASTDGSVDRLDGRGLPLQVIRNGVNIGFGAACNQAAERCTSDILLMLNPDTLQRRGALAGGLAPFADPQVGAVGVRLDNQQGTTRACCRPLTMVRLAADHLRLHRVWPTASLHLRDFDHRSSRDVAHVIGAYYFVRRELFSRLGGFDERFFVYFEDLDLSARITAAGYRIRFEATVAAWHEGCGTSQNIRAARLAYSQFSRLQLAAKHGGWAGLLLVAAAVLLAEPPLRAALALRSRRGGELRELVRGYAMLLHGAIRNWRTASHRVALQAARQRSVRSGQLRLHDADEPGEGVQRTVTIGEYLRAKAG